MAEIALVTGAYGTLGQEVAEMLAAASHQLVLSGRDTEKLTAVAIENAYKFPAELSDPDQVEQLFEAILDQFGEPPTLLAHCAGSVLIRPLHRTTVEQYRTCLENNLNSAFFVLQGFVQRLLEAKKPGQAVLISSVAAKIGINNHAAIAATKGGIEALVRTVAATYSAHGIRCNGIAPALMKTGATKGLFAGEKAEQMLSAQYPLGRYGEVAEAARLICWLLSENAAWITGQTIALDGGFSAVRPLVKH